MSKKDTTHEFFSKVEKVFKRTPTEKEIMLGRAENLAKASFASVSILVLVGIGVSSVSLRISLICFSFCIPFLICSVTLSQVYLFLGKKSYAKVRRAESGGFKYWVFVNDILFFIGFTCLIWHLSRLASVVFIASVITAVIIFYVMMVKLFENKKEVENKG